MSPATPKKTASAYSSHQEVRQIKRSQRQLLTESEQQQHSLALCQNIIKENIYRNSNHIGVYLANDGEIDPQQLIEHAGFLNKKIYLPILSPLKHSLYFAPYKTGERLRLNRYNIPEPICHPSAWKTAAQLDLLLMPLVAFDVSGNRIGMGGGYYDRTLAYLQHRRYWKKPKLAGLAHDIQQVEQIKNQDWDIPLDYIITEKQFYTRC